jgi:hypothetical protein
VRDWTKPGAMVSALTMLEQAASKNDPAWFESVKRTLTEQGAPMERLLAELERRTQVLRANPAP